MAGRFYTKEEDDLLIKNISESPHNLREAYRKTALETGRTWKACEQRWYNLVESGRANKVFVGVGKCTTTFDRKNVYRDVNTVVNPIRKSKWRRILAILLE